MRKEKILQILCSIVLVFMMTPNLVLAQELSNSSANTTSQNNSITIGNDASNSGTPVRSSENGNVSNIPKITHFVVNGDVDNTKTGIDFYKNITITLIGENLTDRNFLTKEGLHWSDKTYVELIKGQELGILNDSQTFGAQNTPTTEVKAYSNNQGDSGRINFVGRTKSDEDLDLIWTVIDSDKDDWASNSGYNTNSRTKGLGFAGEQFIPGASGNSIAVLYNNASNLAINYKIVKHGTTEEIPVVLSFISTDIDAAQGVETNLANITEIIPSESGLIKQNNIIYDNATGVVGLNGSVDLPKGGYLGTGFLSSFDYAFYSPAPARVNNSYHYPIAVRYDIFGSSLQANLYTRLKNHITVSYIDEQGNSIKPSENFEGFHDEKYFFESVSIPKYKLIDIKKDETDLNHPKIQFVYRPVYSVSLKFVDEKGNKLSEDKTFLVEKGYILSYNAPTIDSYSTPNVFNTEVNRDVQCEFVYKKIAKLDDKKEDGNPQNNSQSTKPIVKEPIKENTKPSIRTINNSARPNVNVNSYPIGIPKNKTQISNYSNKKTVSNISNVRDPFLENAGMSKEEKEAFLKKYIRAVAKDSKERNGNDINKINHDVSNAIIYDIYYNNFKQKITNDFGKKPKALDDYMIKLLRGLHNKDNYIIDFPHLVAPLSTSEKSVWWKQIAKFIIGFNSQGVPT